MISQDWPAPAKLNLFLHITGRRADGYHLLQTLFQFVDYGDTLSFTIRPDGRVRRLGEVEGVSEAQDLVIRAARLLQRASGCTRGADINLHKRLPMGGGLGGGSSDAATTLVALNRLWALNWPTERLAELALQLGADVPVFVKGEAAWAEGIGERLEPVELPEPWYVVIAPPVQVPTPLLFAHPELTRDCPPIKIRAFLDGETGNVFQPLVCRLFPAVAEAMAWLGQHGNARLTGSGGCIFAAFEHEQTARRIHAAMPEGWRGFVARGRNRSPLLERLHSPA